ncbi:MAG: hypothetical protein AB1656_12530 [Candidatus Omnitrophota bacterium]
MRVDPPFSPPPHRRLWRRRENGYNGSGWFLAACIVPDGERRSGQLVFAADEKFLSPIRPL